MDFLFFSPFPLPTAKHRSRLKTLAFNKTLITAAMSLKYRVEKPPQVCLFIHSFNSCQKKYDLFILIAYLFIYFNLLLKMQLFLYIIFFFKCHYYHLPWHSVKNVRGWDRWKGHYRWYCYLSFYTVSRCHCN